jgi:hypothetical protein
MLSFRKFLAEMHTNVPVVNIDTTGTDISIPEIKNQLNRNIDLELRQSFVTVEAALEKISKILAMYALDIPQVDSNDIKSGGVILTVGRYNIKWDEFTGKVDEIPLKLQFKFKLDNGLYKCSAKLL